MREPYAVPEQYADQIMAAQAAKPKPGVLDFGAVLREQPDSFARSPEALKRFDAIRIDLARGTLPQARQPAN